MRAKYKDIYIYTYIYMVFLHVLMAEICIVMLIVFAMRLVAYATFATTLARMDAPCGLWGIMCP